MAMPSVLKKSLMMTALLALGWLAGWGLSDRSDKAERAVKLRTLASVQARSTYKMEKHLMPVHVELIGPEQFPEGSYEPVVLRAKLRTPFQNFQTLNFEWLLPEDVQVLSGQRQGQILNPVADQTYEIQIELQNFDRQYRKELTLRATVRDSNGLQLLNTAIMTSRPEDSMEHLAPVMMVKAQEARSRQPASEDSEK
ncbi:MAG: hypothetical protein ACK5Y2_07020 [Bdellovibrionales bacterium]